MPPRYYRMCRPNIKDILFTIAIFLLSLTVTFAAIGLLVAIVHAAMEWPIFLNN